MTTSTNPNAGAQGWSPPPFAVPTELIQSHIVRSLRPHRVTYLFFQIMDVEKFRQRLMRWLNNDDDLRIFPQNQMLPEHQHRSAILPLTIAFTWTGLARLGIHEDTLATFPEPFREGMAARADLLGDKGASAPENWQGSLGSPKIHGLLGIYQSTIGWSDDRFDQHMKNIDEPDDQKLLEKYKHLEANAGIVVRHRESGRRPYRRLNDRWSPVEHFGFRDGLSQPFLNLSPSGDLIPPPPGGGHPRPDGTWDPVMPGEILLGYPDEDNLTAIEPINAELRFHGTYMVFRKLAQDVVGFHNLLRKNRSRKEDQHRLAAQMMGRWPNGAPIVRHPHDAYNYGSNDRHKINDFRYFDEDPHGRKCPLDAHVRRTNPRDTQLRDFARRHRILRQSIPYGGSLVDDPDRWDGKERGLLFVCYNARIDSQFELIQSHWINRGEMFGQAGLGRCPITGSNLDVARNCFHVPDNPAPVDLAELTTNRGGDYFFVPGLEALKKLANKGEFPPPGEKPAGFVRPLEPCLRGEPVPLAEAELRQLIEQLPPPSQLFEHLAKDPNGDPRYFVLGSLRDPSLTPNPSLAETKQLFVKERLIEIAKHIIWDRKRMVRIPLQFVEHVHDGDVRGKDPVTTHIAFVVFYEDVKAVLGGENFSVEHHRKAFDVLTRGKKFLMGMEEWDHDRRDRLNLLHDALFELFGPKLPEAPPSQWFKTNLTKLLRGTIAKAMARVLPTGKMDVVRDFGLVIPAMVAQLLFGLPGPNRISPTGIAAIFARLEFTDVPADWLKKLPPSMEHEKPMITVLAWAQAVFREIFVNIIRARELTDHGRRMVDEMMAHIEDLMEKEYRRPIKQQSPTLLSVLMKRRRELADHHHHPEADALNEHAKLILAELLVGGIYTVGKAFTNIIDFMLNPQFVTTIVIGKERYEAKDHDLSDILFCILGKIAKMPEAEKYKMLDAFIAESLRFAFQSVLFRVCQKRTQFGDQWIEAGDLVTTIVAVANLDSRAFPFPSHFKLDRPPENYLHFGVEASTHYCLGAELAKSELREMLLAIGRLNNVRRAAGPRGKLEELLLLPQSLVIRFDPVSISQP